MVYTSFCQFVEEAAELRLPLLSACGTAERQLIKEPLSSPDLLKSPCALIGVLRIEKISGHVCAAIGYRN